eukprot:TRINITY_DN327_c0_g1_i2.p1 TRINITY_DN327_c0_g1~~TRINITY_DN327_c0_g1_i2.p1  ORF type:complete len:1088 (-),score=310.84 TRINITY_DN327_c0_g1_i2:63-3032(-)
MIVHLPEFGNSTKLKTLMISQNKLLDLPESISNLKSIANLQLGTNSLKSFPISFSNLLTLTNIDFSFNQFQTFPDILLNFNLTDLSIQGNSISELPTSLGDLQSLSVFLASSNLLAILPPSIGRLPATKLDFSNNMLTSIPDSLFQIKSLTAINLDNNKLTSFPEFGDLPLEIIQAESNRLKSIPGSISNLKNLTSLELGFNEITFIPDTPFSRLTILNLNHNRLSSLPIIEGHKLESCDLSYNFLEDLSPLCNSTSLLHLASPSNKLKNVPECFGNLTSLKYLFLSSNSITFIPESIGDIESITTIDLSFNLLTSLPSSLKKLTNVYSLMMNDNLFPSFPTVILSMPKITELGIGVRSATEIPDGIFQMKRIESLAIPSSKIKTIPRFISNLKKLVELQLFDNKIEEIPEEICQLPIQFLTLSSNRLKRIPSCICQIPISLLSLSQNSLTELPSDFYKLRSTLRYLYLDGNSLLRFTDADVPNYEEMYSFSCQLTCSNITHCTHSSACELCSSYNGQSRDICESTPSNIKCKWCEKESTCIEGNESCNTKSNGATTVIIVITLSVSFSAVVIVTIFFLKKKNRNQNIEMDFAEIAFSAGTKTNEMRNAIATIRKCDNFSEIGLSCSVNEINAGQSIEVNSTMKFEFELKNKGEESFEIELFFEETVDPHIIAFSPEKFFLKAGESQKIEFSIKMICTARIDTSIIVASLGRGYCVIPFRLESSPSCFLSLGEIKLGKMLGKGAFGTVFIGKYREEEVAVKQYSINSEYLEMEGQIQKEIKLMSTLKSPFIVSFIGTTKAQNNILIVLEYCKFGSLSSHFGQNKLPTELKRMIAIDCAKGMKFLHHNKIVHRDLKPENVLMVSFSSTSFVRAKISDFGTSRMVIDESKQAMTSAVGTPAFMAPETLDKGSEYSLPCDVYSFAILLWSLWNEAEPYSDFQTIFAVYTFVSSGNRLPISSDCPFADVINNSWKQEPSERPTFDQILEEMLK